MLIKCRQSSSWRVDTHSFTPVPWTVEGGPCAGCWKQAVKYVSVVTDRNQDGYGYCGNSGRVPTHLGKTPRWEVSGGEEAKRTRFTAWRWAQGFCPTKSGKVWHVVEPTLSYEQGPSLCDNWILVNQEDAEVASLKWLLVNEKDAEPWSRDRAAITQLVFCTH